MIVEKQELDLTNSREEVFDYLVDIRNELKWNPSMKAGALVSGDPIAKGSVFEMVRAGSGKNTLTVTEFQRPTNFSLHGSFRGGQYDYRGVVTGSQGGGSHVSGTLTMNLKFPMSLMTPMVRKRLKADLAASGDQIRAGLGNGD